MNKQTFHLSGTHCASCKILIEDILNEKTFIQNPVVNIKNETLSLESDSPLDSLEIVEKINNLVRENGYSISLEKKKTTKKVDEDIWKALPLGLLFLVLFFILQKSGILNLGIGAQTTPLTSFIIGLIASVSSCLAIVGGLVLSLSAKTSQDTRKPNKPIFIFHMSRLASFALLGGVFGLIGSAIGVNFVITAILGLTASLIMLILGLNLLGIFKKSLITLPTGIFKFFKKIEHESLTPLLIGFGTFFLPCGFTQAMQVAALSSGSFMGGFLVMLGFALGTLPVLLLLSFGSASFAQSKHAPVFFKSAGVVVVGLGLFALLSGLASLGIISPIINI